MPRFIGVAIAFCSLINIAALQPKSIIFLGDMAYGYVTS